MHLLRVFSIASPLLLEVLLSPFHRRGNRGSEILSNLPKDTQQVNECAFSLRCPCLWSPGEQLAWWVRTTHSENV